AGLGSGNAAVRRALISSARQLLCRASPQRAGCKTAPATTTHQRASYDPRPAKLRAPPITSIAEKSPRESVDIVPHHTHVGSLYGSGVAHSVGEKLAADCHVEASALDRSLERLDASARNGTLYKYSRYPPLGNESCKVLH